MAPEDTNSENQAVDRAALRDRMLAAAQAGTSQDDNEEQPTTEGLNEEDALRNLTGAVRDQNELERDITLQANAALMEADDKKDQNRIDKLQATKHRLQLQLDKEKKRLEKVGTNIYQSRNIQKEIAKLDDEIQQVSSDISDFQARIEKRHQENAVEDSKQAKSKKLPGESNREFLIRTGKITPFAKIGGPRPAGIEGQLADTILDAEEEAAAEQLDEEFAGPTSHQRLRRPGFADELEPETTKPVAKPETTAVETEFFSPTKEEETCSERSKPICRF
ncbi:DNA repair protein rhp26 [Fusarium solani]